MSILDKIAKGEQFSILGEVEFLREMLRVDDLCNEYNNIPSINSKDRKDFIRNLFGETKGDFMIFSPFRCSIGKNISIGHNVMINSGGVFLDLGKISIGNGVWIGPNCSIYSSGHALDPEQRSAGMGYAHDVVIGENVWIGGGVIIACGEKRGIEIGANSVVAAGSVVTKDVPKNVVVAGNPAKIIRHLDKGNIE